jgi:lactate dehydrogenase-like 2-hydroxyacid dehydrogenase
MKIQYHNRNPVSPAPDFPAEYCDSLDKLLATSDVVSLHLPLNSNTRNGFGKAQFDKMKDGAILVNTARGAVVDQEALIAALESGKVGRSRFRDGQRVVGEEKLMWCSCIRLDWTSSPASESLPRT